MDAFERTIARLATERATGSPLGGSVRFGRDERIAGYATPTGQADSTIREMAFGSGIGGKADAVVGVGGAGAIGLFALGSIRQSSTFPYFRVWETIMNGGALFVAACFLLVVALSATITVKVVNLERATMERAGSPDH